jgi:hypothetical protein
MGPFNLDELIQKGIVESQGITLLSPERWAKDREKLINTHANLKTVVWPDNSYPADRKALGLPANGALFKAEIEQAFRRASKEAHPDRGGSRDRFISLAEAKERLLRSARK